MIFAMKDIQFYVLHLSPMLDLETLLTNIFLELKLLCFLKVHPHKEKHKNIFHIFLKSTLKLQLGNKQAYEALQEGGEEGLKEYIYSKMWNPEYRPLVYLPPGKGE